MHNAAVFCVEARRATVCGVTMTPHRHLHFIRHAETDLAGRFCGAADPPINERGRAQLPALVARLATAPLTAIYTSGLQRARQTAEALAEARELPLHALDSLREIGFGQWETLSWEEIEARDPAYARRWVAEFPALPTPDGEPIGSFRARVLKALEHLRTEGTGDLAIVTHAGVLRVLLEELGHYPAHHAWERTRDYTCIIACTQTTPGARIEVT